MGFFDSLLGDDFFGDVGDGVFGTDYLKDFTHAKKLFRSDAYALAPNQKFLFHVFFTLNVPYPSSDSGLVGALVKSVQLPSYSIDTKEYIQYNRKRNVHNKIEYRPVDIKLHDDSSDTVRSLWYNYYSYYFADSDYAYDSPVNNGGPQGNGMAYNGRDIYKPEWTHPAWGMSTKSASGSVKPPFFKNIKIYGMSRGNYILYTVVNPVITEWRHDTYDYAQADGIMEHSMSVKYEAVKYSKGKVSDGIPGFAEPQRYDTSPSPLGKPGSTASVLGQAGLVDSGLSALDDLANGNILGAIKTVGTQYRTFENADMSFKDIVRDDVLTEARNQLPGVVNNLGRQVGDLFPSNNGTGTVSTPPAGRVRPTPINGGTNG